MTETQILLNRLTLSILDTERQNEILSEKIRGDTRMLEAAVAIYHNFCASIRLTPEIGFLDNFIQSWVEFSLNALSQISALKPLSKIDEVQLGCASSCLLVFWHFPEYPLVIQKLLNGQVITAVAQNAEWMQPLAKAGLALNFRETKDLFLLRRAFKCQRPLAMMADYCYEETRHRVLDFLGLRCRTPSGLIELALRFNYSIRFVTVRDRMIVAETLPRGARSVDDVLGCLNQRISREIEKRPSRWLLWASLNMRRVEGLCE